MHSALTDPQPGDFVESTPWSREVVLRLADRAEFLWGDGKIDSASLDQWRADMGKVGYRVGRKPCSTSPKTATSARGAKKRSR